MREALSTDLEAADQAPHYLQDVTAMGEHRQIVAQQDIYAENGMKLLAKGALINESQRERLNLHKLRTPIDFLLATDTPVDATELALEASKLLATDLAMLRLTERCGDPLGFKQAIGSLELPAPLQFRLTVMRDRRPALFVHSLRVALIAHAVGTYLGRPDKTRTDLLLAGLAHDLGEMHTDPALLEPGYLMSGDERRYVHVHPVTGFVLLRDMAGMPPAVAQAVLQHHERLDGSGYPHGLRGEALGELGRIVAAAEVLAGAGQWGDPRRVEVLLRLNQRRLDQEVCDGLRALLRADREQAAAASEEGLAAVSRLEHVGAVLAQWDAIQAQCGGAALAFLHERLAMLRSLALQTGINPSDAAALFDVASSDNELLGELNAITHELGWLLADLAHEIDRRLPAPAAQLGEFIAVLRARV